MQDVILAVPHSAENDALEGFAKDVGVRLVRGSETDVLDRFRLASEQLDADVLVRITADCPMVDPAVIDRLVLRLLTEDLDYIRTDESYPNGFDVEVFTAGALLDAAEHAHDPYDREHVCPYIARTAGDRASHDSRGSLRSPIRVTIDEPEDVTVVRAVFEAFGHDQFTIDDVEDLARTTPAIFEANSAIARNAGAEMTNGEKLHRRASKVLLSNGLSADSAPPDKGRAVAPRYVQRAAGCSVWDLDGREFLDISDMGAGACLLGYKCAPVDDAVRRVIEKGNAWGLHAPEEVDLAERLLAAHVWADRATFTRSDDDAWALAIEVARAASDRPVVAAYPAPLTDRLLQPDESTPATLACVDLESLEAALSSGDIGAVVVDVASCAPEADSLVGARRLTQDHGVLLVLDERRSAFRRVLGGFHLHHHIDPDLVILGGSLANGYGLGAVIGRRSILERHRKAVTCLPRPPDRVSVAAGLASFDTMARLDAPARVHGLGVEVLRRWTDLASSHSLELECEGPPAFASYVLRGSITSDFGSALRDELLEHNIVAGMGLCLSTAHTEEHLDRYFDVVSHVLDSFAGLS